MAQPRLVSASPNFGAVASYVESLPLQGTISIWIGLVTGAACYSHEADAPHDAASTMKLPLVMAAFDEAAAGRLDLDTQIEVANTFTSALDGSAFSIDPVEDSDPEVWRRLDGQVSLRWLAYRSLVASSNLATNLLLAEVGTGPVASLLSAAGATESMVNRGIEDLAARAAGLHNLITAADLARLLQSLSTSTVLSAHDSAEILDVLAAQQINDALPAQLPRGVKVAHKSGWNTGVSHDAGIVYPANRDPFLVVVCTTSDLDEESSLDVIATTAALAWAQCGDRP